MAELKPIEVDKNGLAKVSDGRYVNPNYATPESMAGILKNQNPQVSPQVINSSVLGSNETPVTIPQVNQSSVAPSLSAISSSVVPQTKAITALEQETAKKAEEEKSFLNRQKEKIQGLMQSVIGVKGSQATLESEAKIGEKIQKVTDLTNQIESLDRAEQNELRAIQQVGSLTDVQKNAQTRAIQRQYAFQKADLALLQSAANRDLLTAQSIVDRKIQLQLEPLQMQLEFEKMFYDENRDILNAAEQRQFEIKIRQDERNYEDTKNTITSLEKTRLNLLQSASEQGAPVNILAAISSAKTQEEAIIAAGQWGGDMVSLQLKRLQLKNALESANSGQTVTGKPLTQAQQTSLSYANRVSDSNQIIDEVGSQFTGAGSYFGQFAPNFLKSNDRQRYEQAQRNFINAVLRRESGAAIAESEFDSARKQYFPQPGDSQPVIEQKRINRERTLENLLREGGQIIAPTQSSNDPLQLGIGGLVNNPLGI